jgi:Na+/phosphate symporter
MSVEKILNGLKREDEGKYKIACAFLSAFSEVSKKHPVLEEYKEELLENFIKHLSENEPEIVKSLSALKDDDLERKALEALENAVQKGLVDTILGKMDKGFNALAKGIIGVAKGVENISDTIVIHDQNLRTLISDTQKFIKNTTEEVKKHITDEFYAEGNYRRSW